MKTLIIFMTALLSFSAFASDSNKCVISSSFFEQINTPESVEVIAETLEEKGYTFENETDANRDSLISLYATWNLYNQSGFFYSYTYLSLTQPNGRKHTAETKLKSFLIESYNKEGSFKRSASKLPDCKDLK